MVLQYNQDARVNGGHCVFLLEERGGDKTGNGADTLTTAVIVMVTDTVIRKVAKFAFRTT